MSYLVDSNLLIDARIGIPAAVSLLASLRTEGLAVSIVSYGELFEGAMGAADSLEELFQIRDFLQPFRLLPLSDPIMEVFARTRADLRRTGRLIPDLDLLIASTAIQYDLTLLTRNVRHFGRISQVRLHRPS